MPKIGPNVPKIKIRDKDFESFFPNIRHRGKRNVLRGLAETGFVRMATDAAGVALTTHYHWKTRDPEYCQAATDAMEYGMDACEAKLAKRAFDGVEKAVFYKGKRCDDGKVLQYSDLAAIAILNARRPNLYHREAEKVTPTVNYNVYITEYGTPSLPLTQPKEILVNPEPEAKELVEIKPW